MEKIWFLEGDGRAPQTLYVMYDHDVNEPIWEIHFKQGKQITTEKYINYNIEKTKWSEIDFITSWDFLPNSSRIPLANERALKVLEEVAHGEFQAIPTEIRLPDGQILKDYKLINVLNKVKCVIDEKSKPKKNPSEWDKYEVYALDPKPFQNLNIAITETLSYVCSEKLKKEIKKADLKGLTFKEKWLGEFFAYE